MKRLKQAKLAKDKQKKTYRKKPEILQEPKKEERPRSGVKVFKGMLKSRRKVGLKGFFSGSA